MSVTYFARTFSRFAQFFLTGDWPLRRTKDQGGLGICFRIPIYLLNHLISHHQNLLDDGAPRYSYYVGLCHLCRCADIVKHHRYLLWMQDEDKIGKRISGRWWKHALVSHLTVVVSYVLLRCWLDGHTIRGLYIRSHFPISPHWICNNHADSSKCLRTDLLQN